MPSCSRKFCTGLFSLLVVLSAVPLSADTFTAFGPKTYVRLSGTPVTVTDNFSILNPSTQYTLVVTNNGITNGIITINGVQVAVESDFTNNPTGFQKSITLKSSDQIGVRLFAPVGGSIIVEIMGAVGTATATHFTLAAPASATSGVAFSFTVTAQDQFNNPATGYSGTVHFSSSDGAATLPVDSTLSSGTGTFSATLKTAGSQTLTATDTVTASITGTSGAITVSPAAATHFTLAAPASATSGVAFSFTVTAQDQFNNTVTGYSGTVHFSSSDGAATLPVDSTLSSGTGTFSATLKTAGSRTITATDTVSSSITGTSGAITVSPAAATHFTLAAPASATSGVAFSFTVTAQDQFNNTATGYSGTVHFSSSDGAATLPVDSTLSSGTGTFSATLKTAGSRTITATDTVSSSITGTSGAITASPAAATHFTLAAPASATSGVAFSFTVTAQDQFNNTATGYSGTVHFSSSDGAATLPVDSTLSSGTGTFSATLKTAGSQTLTATDTVTASITGSATIGVNAGGATHFSVSAPSSATAGTAFSFTVAALDASNNPVTGYTGTVHFTSSDAQAALPGNYTFTAGDAGTHTFSATLKTAGTQSITATDTASGTITGSQTGIVVNSAPLTSIIVTPANSSAMIGTTVPFTATGVYLDNSTQNLTNSVTWAATNLSQLNSYKQTNLVSDTQGLAPVVDPKLINPWGVAFLPGGPFWVADNGSGFATLYNQSGAIQGSYAIPGPNGSSAPTGIVANTEGGTILGWNGGSAAVLALDNSASGAVYKGLALIQKGSSQFLLATNFNSGNVDIFDTTFKPATFTGTFTDPNLPAGYAPFGIEVINGQVVVTYALQDATKKQAVRQAGAGYVDLFDTDGNLVRRVVSQGNLNAPWGVTLSPLSFGAFGGDLLVGNFGDGTINAYNFTTGAFIGQMQDENGAALINAALWALKWGGGGASGDPNTLYITAGLGHGKHGLFSAISPNPSVASINSAGTATALTTGTSTISATLGNISGSTTLTVTPALLLSIAVLPANPSVAAGNTEQSIALGTFSDNSTEILTNGVTWASSITATAGVDSTGLASAVQAGTTSISATI